MRFYMVNTLTESDSHCKWFTSLAEAKKYYADVKRQIKDDPSGDFANVFSVKEYDIPTRKKELLDWLNQCANPSLGYH